MQRIDRWEAKKTLRWETREESDDHAAAAHRVLARHLCVCGPFALHAALGKRQVSQLTFFDYVVGITIGSIAGNFTTNLQVEASVHWTGLLTWTLWTLVLGVITVHSRKMSKIIAGEPTIVIHNGQILEGNFEKMNFAMDDLRAELREKKIFNLADVEFALLERNGKLSVLKKSQLHPVTPADLQLSTGTRVCRPS